MIRLAYLLAVFHNSLRVSARRPRNLSQICCVWDVSTAIIGRGGMARWRAGHEKLGGCFEALHLALRTSSDIARWKALVDVPAMRFNPSELPTKRCALPAGVIRSSSRFDQDGLALRESSCLVRP
jgi:hypothetical protein